MIAEFLHSVQDRLFPHLFVEARLWAPLSHSLAVWLAKLGFYSKLEPFYSQFLVDLLNNLRPLTHHFSLDKALGLSKWTGERRYSVWRNPSRTMLSIGSKIISAKMGTSNGSHFCMPRRSVASKFSLQIVRHQFGQLFSI